uniref:Caspase family p20 domain-containing protein n=2 Tax=Arion vulgaris TaxID=1028688 RepID=A0A0B7BKL1_9EUPU
MDDSESDGCNSLPEESRYCQETTVCEETCYGTDVEYSYRFSYPRRGVAVIICNDRDHEGHRREGSEIDLKCYYNAFSHLGFDVLVLYNEKRAQLLESLKRVSNEDHSDCDCFVLAVSSHGDKNQYNGVQEDVIFTIDHPVKSKEIMTMFADKSCPSLAGKPKLFFIQACRGYDTDSGVDVYSTKASKKQDLPSSCLGNMDTIDAVRVIHFNNHAAMSIHHNKQQLIPNHTSSKNTANSSLLYETTGGRKVLQEQGVFMKPVIHPAPCYKDFLVMYSTPPGYYSFRRPDSGSWFVRCLSDVLLNSDGNTNLMRELTRVTGMVADRYISASSEPLLHDKKQTPVIYSMLSKDIYLS